MKRKVQAGKVYGYRLNYFTAADFAHKRFAAIEVVTSRPLPRQISGESGVYYLISSRSSFQAIRIDSFGLTVLFSIIENLKKN